MNNTELKDSLTRLVMSPDWQTFVAYIKKNDIAALINELKMAAPLDFPNIQYRLRVMEELTELPQKILEGLSEEVKETNDPYPKNIEEVKAMDALESVSGGEN